MILRQFERLVKEDKTRISIKGEGVNTVKAPEEWGSSELEEITDKGEGVKAVNTPVEGDPDFSEKKSTDNNTKDTDDGDGVYPYNESQASQESLPESIHRIHPKSDIWECDNCTLRDDKWGMIRHPCKHNLKHKDNKLGCP